MKTTINTAPFIESARAAFGHFDGITDEECLCLRISQLSRGIAERNAAWNENQSLRDQIVKLQAQLLTKHQ